jgi:hypothetical protein
MMEHDTGRMPPNELAQDTVDAVRHALAHHARQPAEEPADDVRAALHALAREARVKAIPPEQLLRVLKALWQSLPEVENARDHTEQTKALQRVVTMCIKEYFAD